MFTPRYTTVDNVKVRLISKVQFQQDPAVIEQGEIPDALLHQIIRRAESKVELDVRSRYAIPFRSKRTCQWADLPEHTKSPLLELIDLMAVRMVLGTDFGRGTHVNAEGYVSTVKEEYSAQLLLVLGRDSEASNEKRDRYRFSPPLEDLVLAPTNREADDGYKGMIINTDQSQNDAASYAADQINNPARSYLARRPIGGIL